MTDWNLLGAWIGIFAGMASGATIGLFFYRPDWLGGYATWPRRLVRLGHISFFGLALINLAFVQTLVLRGFSPGDALPLGLHAASLLFLAGAVLMPTVCFLSAWRGVARHFFFLPVGSLLAAVLCLILSEIIP